MNSHDTWALTGVVPVLEFSDGQAHGVHHTYTIEDDMLTTRLVWHTEGEGQIVSVVRAKNLKLEDLANEMEREFNDPSDPMAMISLMMSAAMESGMPVHMESTEGFDELPDVIPLHRVGDDSEQRRQPIRFSGLHYLAHVVRKAIGRA